MCIRSNTMKDFEIAAKWGNLAYFRLSRDDLYFWQIENCFMIACRYEQLHLVEWFIKNYDLQKMSVAAVKECCSKGQTVVIQWLLNKYNWEDLSTIIDIAFNSLVANEHFDTAAWVHKNCKYAVSSQLLCRVFIGECGDGNIEFIKQIYKHRTDDLPIYNGFVASCTNGHTELAKLLYQGLCVPYIFVDTCINRHFITARWMMTLGIGNMNTAKFVENFDSYIKARICARKWRNVARRAKILKLM